MKQKLAIQQHRESGWRAIELLLAGSVLIFSGCRSKRPPLPDVGEKQSDVEVERQLGRATLPANNTSRPESASGAIATHPDTTITPTTIPLPATDATDEAVTPPVPVTGTPAADNVGFDGRQVLQNARYFIKSAASKKCLSLPNNARSNGLQLIQRTCDVNSGAQKFDVAIMAEGYFRITNFETGKSLEIRDQNPVAQAAIQQNDYFAKNYQQFIIEKRSDNFYAIRARMKRLYVDVAGASIAEGTLIQLWENGDGINQAWIFEPTY